MNAKRVVLGVAVVVFLTLGSARMTQAQVLGGFGNNAGFNALGGTTQFGSPAFANPGFGVGGYGAISNLNTMGAGLSPYGGGYGYYPYGAGYGYSPYRAGYGYSPYGGVYGGSPYGYRYGYGSYNAYGSPYLSGGVIPTAVYVGPPPVMLNQTNSLMGTIQSNTGRGNWRLRSR